MTESIPYWHTRTIAEAETEGYTHLREHCPRCGRTTDLPWRLVLGRHGVHRQTSEWQDLKRQSAIAKLGMSEAGWKQIEIEFCATITRWRQPLKVLQTPTYSLRKPHFALFSWTRWIVG